jgi:hypothetical protein
VTPAGRANKFFSSLPEVNNSVLCLLPPFSDAFGGHPKAWKFAVPEYTNWRAYKARGILPSSQSVKLLQPTAAPSTQRRESSIVIAAQKWITDPSTRDSSYFTSI